MAKVTLNENFVPCSRPLSANASDLTENIDLTRKVVRVAAQIFWLKKGMQKFSGFYIAEPGLFSIEIWRKETMLRALRLPLAYSGTLYIDIEEHPSLALGTDILGDLHRAEAQSPDTLQGLEMTLEGNPEIPLKRQSAKKDAYFCVFKKLKDRTARERLVARMLDYLESA